MMNYPYPEQEPAQPQGRLMPVEFLQMLFNIDDLLERIEVFLRGEMLYKKEDGTYERKKIGEKLLNEQGIQEIMQIMRKRLDNVIYSASNLDMDYIRMEVWFFNLNLAELAARRAKEWNLKKEHYQELIDHLVSSYESILRKALGALYLKVMFGVGIAEEQAKEKERKRFLFF